MTSLLTSRESAQLGFDQSLEHNIYGNQVNNMFLITTNLYITFKGKCLSQMMEQIRRMATLVETGTVTKWEG